MYAREENIEKLPDLLRDLGEKTKHSNYMNLLAKEPTSISQHTYCFHRQHRDSSQPHQHLKQYAFFGKV